MSTIKELRYSKKLLDELCEDLVISLSSTLENQKEIYPNDVRVVYHGHYEEPRFSLFVKLECTSKNVKASSGIIYSVDEVIDEIFVSALIEEMELKIAQGF